MHFSSFARATSGQVLLFYIHVEIDVEERERNVHLHCLPKLREIKCEVCGEPVNPLHDYADIIGDKTYSPREYVEHQLHMSEEEKEARRLLFEGMFAEYDREKEMELA